MINQEDLMEIARETGLAYLDGSSRHEYGYFIDYEICAFSRAILERAAVECEKTSRMHAAECDMDVQDAAAARIRALKPT